jgi:two-component system sensor histidine kinase BaeS
VSFRVRVLLWVMVVAVSATAATAWLALRQASAQITESATADQAQVEQITRELRDYGYRHGTWIGVPDLVRDLGRRSDLNQRIKLTTEDGTVISDTDTIAGITARQTPGAATLVDPVPTLRLNPELPDPERTTLTEIDLYRRGVLLAACLTTNGFPIRVTEDAYGVPRYELALPDGGPDNTAQGCPPPAVDDVASAAASAQQDVAVCRAEADRAQRLSCLRAAFRRQVDDVAPVRTLVYLGAEGGVGSPLQPAPVLLAAAGVALLALVGTVLLSRRVVRPIGVLTAASRRLGEGDLTGRVPVSGNDELAQLARSFNRMADSLQRGEERQRRLVADVAHELRTPLANLRGYLEALKDGVITPDADLFASLHDEAVLQQRIVDDLQDLALAEAGTLAYHRVPVDLAELLETCRSAHLAVAEAAGVSLVVDAPAPVPVNADPDRLRQVLGNLISNALRATAAGGTVGLRAGSNGGQAGIEVADTGTGIEPQSLPYVFDRFWRADSSRGRRTGGSGLGLAIVRQIVTDHGGTITVRSELGVGTVFLIILPGSTRP